MLGKTISHYKIIEKLGGGGMGVVYKAQDINLDRTVALKFLPPHMLADIEAEQRFISEAKAASSLDHPNICTIHDISKTENLPDVAGDQFYIVMGYYTGETLKKKLEGGPLQIDTAINYATQIATGLARAHEAGIVHRDIKPANIMITDRDEVKILDFGLAKTSSEPSVTKLGSTVGTVSYMSPEQTKGDNVDHRTDIWSLGVLLYQMLSGSLPFQGDYEQAIIYSILNEEPTLIKSLPKDLENILNKALQKNPDDRYDNLNEMLDDLKKLNRTDAHQTIVDKPGKKKKPNAFIVSSIVVSILAFIVVYFVFIYDSESGEDSVDRKKLVVLPFKNLGLQEDEYFADGITEEITSRLSEIEQLGIIGRTSADLYRNTEKPIDQIGEELGVEYLLEGSVRWEKVPSSESRIRVTPQLIKISDGTHIWTKRYDAVIQSVFEVQSDIAEKVAQALNLTLLRPKKGAGTSKLTDNLEAYDYFLKGKHFWNTKSSLEGNQKAVDMFDKAIKLDPDFTLAYAWVSIVHSTLYGYRPWDHTQARKELAKDNLDKALALDPDHPKVHFARGIYQDWCLEDYNSALREYEIVLMREPNNGEIGYWLGHLYKRFGNWKKAEEIILKSYELNPFDLNSASEVGIFYRQQRQFDKAEHYYNLAIQSDPEHAHYYRGKAYNYLYGFGDINKARSLLKEAETIIANTGGLLEAQFTTEILARDFSKALRYAKEEKKINSRTLFVGRTYYYQGKEKLAQEEFESLRIYYENKVLEEGPDKARFQSNLGLIYAYLGLKDKAIEEGKKGTELLPVSKDHIVGPYLVEDLAIIYILTGKHELALDKLEYLLSIPGYLTRWNLRLDPAYDPLRDNPRFQKLIEVGI